MKRKIFIVILYSFVLSVCFSQTETTGFEDFVTAKKYEQSGQFFSAYKYYKSAKEKGYSINLRQIEKAIDKKVDSFMQSPEKALICIQDMEKCFSEELMWDVSFTIKYNSNEKKVYIDVELTENPQTKSFLSTGKDAIEVVPSLDTQWPLISSVDSSSSSNNLINGIPTVDYNGIKFNSTTNKLFDISFEIKDSSGRQICKKENFSVCNKRTLIINNPSDSLIRKIRSRELKVEITKAEVKYGTITGKFDGDFSKVSGLSKKTVDCSKTKTKLSYDIIGLEGKVLNIYVWNDEFADCFYSFYAAKLPADVKVNFVHTTNQAYAYRNKLNEALSAQDEVAANDKVDIFLVEEDYALDYVDSPYTLDVKKDIGLTDADLANQFKYTKDVVTDSKGNLKGVSWQACPGGFLYRRSYAKEVLGTDEPSEVQKMLSNWPKFNAVAAKMKKAGYYMLSGYDDAFRVFADNKTQPWVVDNKIVIDPQIQAWIDQTKEYTDKGYNNKASLWSAESTQGMMEDGKVFGYFGPAWFIDFCMPHDEGSAFGDWAFCKGPQGFSWGGTWICAAAGTDNIELIRDIMLTLTCDADTMTTFAKEKGDFANNEKAMAAVAASEYGNDFLGGQKRTPFFIDSAKSIDKSNKTKYDEGINECLLRNMQGYFYGYIDLDTAWENFYTSVEERYPILHR